VPKCVARFSSECALILCRTKRHPFLLAVSPQARFRAKVDSDKVEPISVLGIYPCLPEKIRYGLSGCHSSQLQGYLVTNIASDHGLNVGGRGSDRVAPLIVFKPFARETVDLYLAIPVDDTVLMLLRQSFDDTRQLLDFGALANDHVLN
jgi:hypothetical protein